MGASLLESKAKRAERSHRPGPRKDPLRRVLGSQVGERTEARHLLGLPEKYKSLTASTQQQSKRAVKKLTHAVIRSLRNQHILTYGQHDPMELVEAAIASFTRKEMTAPQALALEAWKQWISTWDGPGAGGQPISEAIMIFSNLFFLGRLAKVDFEWDSRLIADNKWYGCTSSVGTGIVRVKLDPGDYSKENGVDSHRADLISTLLHECVHAFIRLYRCAGQCELRACKDASGASGHGKAWFHLASNLQAVARIWLQLDIRLGTFSSMIPRGRPPDYVPTSQELHQFVSRRGVEYIIDLGSFEELEKGFARLWDWRYSHTPWERTWLVPYHCTAAYLQGDQEGHSDYRRYLETQTSLFPELGGDPDYSLFQDLTAYLLSDFRRLLTTRTSLFIELGGDPDNTLIRDLSEHESEALCSCLSKKPFATVPAVREHATRAITS